MIRVDAEACTGCRACADVCPHGVIEVRGRLARLRHEERCIECGACQLNCHDDAIFVTKGTGCLLTIIREDILGLGPREAAAR